MKYVNITLKTSIVICTFFIILFSSLYLQTYNLNFYKKKFQQYGVYERFTKEQAIEATKNILGFFKSKNELDSSFFDENDISHLYDVKILLQKLNLIFIVSLIFFISILGYVYFSDKKNFLSFLSGSLFYAGLFTIGLILVLSLLYFITGFDFLFLKFHEIFFIDNYAFDPNVSNMKALFPDMFFLDMTVLIVIKIVLLAITFIGIGLIFKKKN